MPKPLIVITGASAGIGKALAEEFVNDGHPCLLISRSIEPMAEFAGKDVLYAQVDVSDYSALEQAIRDAEEKYGKTECLINNAGMATIKLFKDVPVEKYEQEVDVLLKGVLHGIKIVLEDMQQRKSGTIINVSSVGDRKPSPHAVSYSACKYAVRSIAESLQMGEAINNIRVMNIAPGLIRTDIHKTMGISFEEYCERLGNPTFIAAKELADIIMFCWRQPKHICIRDIVVMPTDCGL